MTKAVIAIIKGGLGNQLFIYAAARAMALRSDRRLFLDTLRGYTNDSYGRNFRLDRFPIAADPMPEEWRIAPTLRHPRHKIIRAWNKCLFRKFRSYIAERHHLDASQLTALDPVRDRVTLLGYWQDEAYFSDYSAKIREDLTLPTPSDSKNLDAGERFLGLESVSLHIRRARYNPRLQAAYYQEAIERIRERVTNPHFVVFGDDPEWARVKLDFRGCTKDVIGHNSNDELADLWLMGRCRHAIVANSSFSWWGAWLARPSPTRQIFFPANPGFKIRAAQCWQSIPNFLDID